MLIARSCSNTHKETSKKTVSSKSRHILSERSRYASTTMTSTPPSPPMQPFDQQSAKRGSITTRKSSVRRAEKDAALQPNSTPVPAWSTYDPFTAASNSLKTDEDGRCELGSLRLHSATRPSNRPARSTQGLSRRAQHGLDPHATLHGEAANRALPLHTLRRSIPALLNPRRSSLWPPHATPAPS